MKIASRNRIFPPWGIQLFESVVDWIPREILSGIVDKAMALVDKEGAVFLHGDDTIIVESAFSPRKPRVVNLVVCAHSVTACVKQKRILEILHVSGFRQPNALFEESTFRRP